MRKFEYAFVVASSNSADVVTALVDSLRYDPFYIALTEAFAGDEAGRRQALACYFDYSMSEGARKGRLVLWPEASIGTAVWLVPGNKLAHAAEAKAKSEFLEAVLGPVGAQAVHLR